MSFSNILPTHSQLIEEEQAKEELPCFGNKNTDEIKFVDPLADDHLEISNLLKKIEQSRPEDQKPGAQLNNNDSFSNIAPAGTEEPATEENRKDAEDMDFNEINITSEIDKRADAKSSHKNDDSDDEKALQAIQPKYDIDETISRIIKEAGLPKGKMMYNPKVLQPLNPESKDDYQDDDDPGFDTYVVNEENFVASCQELARLNDFPERAIAPDTKHDMAYREKVRKEQKAKNELMKAAQKQAKTKMKSNDSALLLQDLAKKKKRGQDMDEADLEQLKRDKSKESEDSDEEGAATSLLPNFVKFPTSPDQFYPAEFDNIVYDCYNLKVVFDREKTGFEETKEFPIVINSIIAGRYQIVEYLGSAAFSKAIQCYDIHTEQMVCLKIIENNKDYFDQSIDEIKLLRFIICNCEDLDEKNLLKVIDYFYHKEHLIIVTELLRDNLYEYSKYNREVEKKHYFDIPRLQKITKQILNALNFIHGLHLIHCDLKPENILIKSYSRSEIKVIDFGSSCFIHDHLSSYVQSRSYRAPEVILGCKYDYKIDIWSLGCILAELYTGYVLFQNDSVQGLLSRVIGIIGPIPEYMMKEGKLVSNFFTREGLIYMEAPDEEEESQSGVHPSQRKKKPRKDDEELKVHILVAKKTTLKERLATDDEMFIDFVRWLLEVDPMKRPSAQEALTHPWLAECVYEIKDE